MDILNDGKGVVNRLSETDARGVVMPNPTGNPEIDRTARVTQKAGIAAHRRSFFVGSVAVCSDGALIPLTLTQSRDNFLERGEALEKQLGRDDISHVASASIAEGMAFDAGFLAGETGVEMWDCPHAAADLSAAWLAGHAAGMEAQRVEDAPAKLPRTVKEADAFFQSGAPAEWFAALPERVKTVNSWDLFHSYKSFLNRVQIARNLETRADELAALSLQIEVQGFTVADLVAFESQQRGRPAFGFMVPDYALPVGYRRADWEENAGGEA